MSEASKPKGYFKKLVRDDVPERMDQSDIWAMWTASDEEFKQELHTKLVEEALEFHKEPSPEELADILEVIEEIRKDPRYFRAEEIRRQKRKRLGGYDKRVMLEGIDTRKRDS